MKLLSELYTQTHPGARVYNQGATWCVYTDEYVAWLEKELSTPALLRWIQTMLTHAESKQWYETYWALDIHGTISVPDYRKGIKKNPAEPSRVIYYPYAKETLQLISQTRPDITLIITSSSYPNELQEYATVFAQDGIHIKYFNENPEVTDAKGSFGFYDHKFYFNVMFEDKAGFNPEQDWEPIYNYLQTTLYRPDPKWSRKYQENYHFHQKSDPDEKN